MAQMLLIPDPRPLVERLGLEFFRQAPQCPGVYLMRDAAETVLYVGKARNLRQRLSSYRVANPDRLRRRHLRLLRAIARIELQPCPDESSALAREAELLRALRPRFNRIGTWPGPPRFLAWRVTDAGLDLVVTTSVESGWLFHGPFRASASGLHAALFRLLWCAVHPGQGVLGMPQGSFDAWSDGQPLFHTQGKVWEFAMIRRQGCDRSWTARLMNLTSGFASAPRARAIPLNCRSGRPIWKPCAILP